VDPREAARADSRWRPAARACIGGSARSVRKGAWSDECPWRYSLCKPGVCCSPCSSSRIDIGRNCRVRREVRKTLDLPQVFKMGRRDENVLDVTTLNVADHRLKNPIHDRRARRYSAGFVVMGEVLRCKGIWRDLLRRRCLQFLSLSILLTQTPDFSASHLQGQGWLRGLVLGGGY
jgi:hypothetical protein